MGIFRMEIFRMEIFRLLSKITAHRVWGLGFFGFFGVEERGGRVEGRGFRVSGLGFRA